MYPKMINIFPAWLLMFFGLQRSLSGDTQTIKIHSAGGKRQATIMMVMAALTLMPSAIYQGLVENYASPCFSQNLELVTRPSCLFSTQTVYINVYGSPLSIARYTI